MVKSCVPFRLTRGYGAECLFCVLGRESKLNILENHSSLLVLPLPIEDERRGLVLSLNTDVRSFGGGVTTNYAYLVVATEESDSLNGEKGLSGTNTVTRTKSSVAAKASAPEKQFMKGLKLLPCD